MKKATSAALAVLCLLYLLMAALPATAGSRLVPVAGEGAPSWLLGVFKSAGSGLARGDGAPLAFYLALWACFLLYITVLMYSRYLPRRATLAVLVTVTIAFALAPPLLSQDVFSYISYERIWVLEGLNPYLYAPSAAPADAAFAYVGWPDATSAYGPLFTFLTVPTAYLSVAGALWTIKAATAVSLLLTLYFTARSCKLTNRDWFRPVLLIGLNPLVLVHVVGGGHNDAVMALLLSFSVWAVLSSRDMAGGIAVVASFSIKASAALAAPFLLAGSKKGLKFTVAVVLSLLLVAAASYVAFGSDIIDSFALVGENQARTSFYSLPNQTSRLIGALAGIESGQVIAEVRAIYLVLFAATLALLLFRVIARRMDWVTGAGWAYFALLCATAWLLPWYIIWLLPLAALSRCRRLEIATLTLSAYMLMIRLPL